MSDEKRSGEPRLLITNGWLVEEVDEHTCGTGRDGYYGHHEPGCGQVPLMTVTDLVAVFDAIAELGIPINDAAALKAVRGRTRDVALTAIRSAWEQQCAGYESLDNCESCRAYDDAILAVEYRFSAVSSSPVTDNEREAL